MHKIILPIDTKSLYYNILNDNAKGHTCTVATPIKQGNSINKQLSEIYKIPKQIDYERNDQLLRDITKNSKSVVKINNVFVFDKLKVNGHELEINKNYCIYIKEEIDKSRVQFGRIKMHYPLTLKNEQLNIDNRKVINSISDFYKGYAFIVESFEYDFNEDTLNFNVLLVGYSCIPYSKVFINNKGVGSKYNNTIKNHIDVYDYEILALKSKYGDNVSIDNFEAYMEKANIIAKQTAIKELSNKGANEIRDVSTEYPYSLFDIQYYKNNEIRYLLTIPTYTNHEYFDLTKYQNQFINLFDNVEIWLIKNIDNSNDIVKINNKSLSKYSLSMSVVRYLEN